MFKLTLLGTGAVGGVPLYGCECEACLRAYSDDSWRREPCSAMVEWEGDARHCLLIDAGLMDLHHRFPAGSYDGFLLTHYHVDHVQGLFHLRWGNTAPIPVWGPDDPDGCADLLKHPGCLSFNPPLSDGKPFVLDGLTITPVALNHSKPTFGYLFHCACKTFAYLTDTDGLPEQTTTLLESIDQIDVLVIDCSFAPNDKGNNHNNLVTAVAISQRIQPKRFVLTHVGHRLDHWLMHHPIPEGIELGADGMTFL
ncbi:phosphonate metabolism protein PhnP [Veronia pacifica]|uniref:Phosphonate metabolism protein PhnP n=1 Tax=Veronia pacifica TaxID=1080227 RepID=A0A1C3EIH3_9GAMM|nr:phosphonate metabolism protein PhnP [Veronia pacifica]ODA33035.1 phosphonate metabolism protein PhnP [Veronia pacifica]